MQFRSVADLNNAVINALPSLPREIDLVVGIPRSGMLPANLIALYRNLPLTDIDGLIGQRLLVGGRRSRNNQVFTSSDPLNVLVIDDSAQSGGQLADVRKTLEAAKLPHRFTFVVVYASEQGLVHVDRALEVLGENRFFEWNIMHHRFLLQRACVDIDGVLCRDPTDAENDDGPNYEHFLLNADPLFVPTVPIRHLVTCRLEKYREHTETWLETHDVEYEELTMLDLPTQEARQASGCHAEFKAGIYEKSNTLLFIESSEWQAKGIFRITQSPVYSVGTNELYSDGTAAPRRPHDLGLSRQGIRAVKRMARRLLRRPGRKG